MERLAHRACNTRKGAVAPVVPWPDHLFVVDPAPIVATVERLQRKGGRDVVARCPTEDDGEAAAAWLVDRISRLQPDLAVTAEVEPGGGQFVVVLPGLTVAGYSSTKLEEASPASTFFSTLPLGLRGRGSVRIST